MKIREEILNQLKDLTHKKKTYLIKKKLDNIDKSLKGKVFEEYLALLFEGNGFIATVNGGSWDGGADILLSRPNNPNKIVWIVQAKNTNKHLGNNIIKEELIKFERESSIKYNCKYFMIISINGYVEKISIFNKTNMSLETFEYVEELINNYTDKKEGVILLPDLRPHNRYTYKEIKAVFENRNRVAVPNATGTGKSYIILQLLFDYIKKNSVVLAPTNEILDNLKSTAPWSITKCRFYTYSKFSSLYSKGKLDNLDIDLIILDELHRAGALNWGKAVKYILEKNNNSKVVGLSATPIRFLDNNRDMINELLYGNSTTPLGLSEAIVRKILPMPVYVSAIYNLDKEIEKKLKLMKKLNLSREDRNKYINELNVYKESWENESRIENIIKKHLPIKDNLKFIVFCENNKHLGKMKNTVSNWFKNILPLKAKVEEYMITSKTTRNKEILSSFENNSVTRDVKLLFTISKLNEGIHIKNISGIIMLRNTKSPSIYYQQLGRCLTADSVDNNPIVFDFVDNIDNLELVNFRTKLEVANAMNNLYRKQIGLYDENVRFSLYEEHEDVILKLKDIEKKITYNWEKSFESLIKFKEVNGHANVPKTLEYLRLYSWVSLQRTLYNKQILNEEFVAKLDSIGFIWNINFYKWTLNYKKYDRLITDSYEKKISYYKIINEEYYIPVYDHDSLLTEYEEDSLLPEKDFIVRWMDKQIKGFQNGELDERRKNLLINEFKEISRFKENKWIKSIYKIIKFYKYIEDNHNIDCYFYKIAPDKSNLIDVISSLYENKRIIKNTIEKNLPKQGKSLDFKYANNEIKNRQLVISLLKEGKLVENEDEFIDYLNSIYFEDLMHIEDMYISS